MRIRTIYVSAGLPAVFWAAGALWAQSEAPKAALKQAALKPAVATSFVQQKAVLNRYCQGCHNDKLKTGGFSVEGLDLATMGKHPDVGEKMVTKLRAGMMPPVGLPRPDAKTYDILASSIEHQLDLAAAAQPNLTAPGVHRLNRSEYANAVRDLTLVDVEPAALLPVDDAVFGFDNNAGALTSSPALIEAYVAAAAKISRAALGHGTDIQQKVYTAPSDYSQVYGQEGMLFGSRGGLKVNHFFPADGDYAFDFTLVRANAGGLVGQAAGEFLDMSLDGKRIRLYDIQKDTPQGGGTAADRHPTKVHVTAGPHVVEAVFISKSAIPADDFNKHFERTSLTQGVQGFNFFTHVNSMSISGPFDGKRGESTPTREKILTCKPASAAEELPCAKKILSSLAARAFRRPSNGTDLERLLNLYQAGRNDGDFEDGIERALQMVLSDPEFIYRTEKLPASVKPGQAYRVSELELASRLSFFLWSAPPDTELINLATQTKLRANLPGQVRRMLSDPKSHEFTVNFAGQWLQLRNLSGFAPIGDIYPDFDDNLRQAFRQEAEMFFESILKEDRNVVDFLDADYTFVNDRLARHYGIPNVYGSQFRRIQLGPEFDLRRGLLGKGAILTATSYANRTSPVQRGKWVLVNVFGMQPPPPPPGVPQLKSDTQTGPVKIITMREQMQMHRAAPACASCHKMMDPMGFAMENFDAIGRYRTMDGPNKLDFTGQLVDGGKFDGTSQLRQQLMRYSPRFVESLTERLLVYALGRGIEYNDIPVARGVVARAAAKGNRFSELILGIAESQPFQMNRAEAAVVVAKN
jgi:mono/diheme cytochrome c family protein